MFKIFFNAYFFILLLISINGQSIILDKTSLNFDTGSKKSKLYERYSKLEPSDIYNVKKGYGWTISPKYSYYKKKMETTTMRDELTIDGVVGKTVEFRADLEVGNWFFTFWMEAGNDYSNTLKLYLNDQETTIDWSPLQPGEGGPDQEMRVYRVFQTKINLVEGGFKYKLVGGKDSVRICGFTLIPEVIPETEEQLEIESLIKSVGNYKSKTSISDVQEHLSQLVDQNPTDEYFAYWLLQVNLLGEAEKFVNMMGWEWARQITNLSIFDRLKQAITLTDGLLGGSNLNDNLLADRALWYRGKIFYDLFLESGGSSRSESAKRDLAILYKKYPEDPNLRMLNGEKIDLPDPYDEMIISEKAPKWSVLQRELYQRLSDEIDWWVNERQAANGELGGKLGDDVELLRWWSSFLLTGNETAIRGWRKLADAVWKSPKVYNGYSKKVYDVEHASEFISDSTPELILLDNDSTYYHRLNYTAEYFENLWTAKNKNGRRFFKSAWYSSTEVDETHPRNIDVDYNSRAVKPLRYLAWATRNKHFIKLLHEWSLAWIDVAMSTAKGKPKGILPSSIRGYDEAINGDGSNWYEANTYWDYFDWHYSVGSKILDNIMFTYILTNDPKLLQPINYSMELVKNFVNKHPNIMNKEYEKGSEGWIVKQMVKNYHFWNVIEKWRLFTNDAIYDNLLKKYGNDYTKYKLTGNISFLEANLENALNEIRFNTPLRTTLVLHTDRVRTTGANTLKAMLTGDGTPESSSPYFAITWEDTDRNFTALVGDYNTNSLSAQLFSHSKNEYQVTARLWLLQNGKYNLTAKNFEGNTVFEKEFVVNKAGDRIRFMMPCEELINIHVEKMK